MITLSEFKKTKDFLVCVDSDGCAMDTMDIKHFNCFGPCMVDEWSLSRWRDPILERWNEINLYTLTRGINRFKGLSLALSEINEQYQAIDGIEDLIYWSDNADELSNASLEKEIEKAPEKAEILLEVGMHCLGCPASQMETLEEACAVHGIDVEELVAKLKELGLQLNQGEE